MGIWARLVAYADIYEAICVLTRQAIGALIVLGIIGLFASPMLLVWFLMR